MFRVLASKGSYFIFGPKATDIHCNWLLQNAVFFSCRTLLTSKHSPSTEMRDKRAMYEWERDRVKWRKKKSDVERQGATESMGENAKKKQFPWCKTKTSAEVLTNKLLNLRNVNWRHSYRIKCKTELWCSVLINFIKWWHRITLSYSISINNSFTALHKQTHTRTHIHSQLFSFILNYALKWTVAHQLKVLWFWVANTFWGVCVWVFNCNCKYCCIIHQNPKCNYWIINDLFSSCCWICLSVMDFMLWEHWFGEK